jgi:hypothetical protein
VDEGVDRDDLDRDRGPRRTFHESTPHRLLAELKRRGSLLAPGGGGDHGGVLESVHVEVAAEGRDVVRKRLERDDLTAGSDATSAQEREEADVGADVVEDAVLGDRPAEQVLLERLSNAEGVAGVRPPGVEPKPGARAPSDHDVAGPDRTRPANDQPATEAAANRDRPDPFGQPGRNPPGEPDQGAIRPCSGRGAARP